MNAKELLGSITPSTEQEVELVKALTQVLQGYEKLQDSVTVSKAPHEKARAKYNMLLPHQLPGVITPTTPEERALVRGLKMTLMELEKATFRLNTATTLMDDELLQAYKGAVGDGV